MTRDIEISLLTKLQKQLEINQVYFETLMDLSAYNEGAEVTGKFDCPSCATKARDAIAKGKEIRDRRD